MSIAMFAYQLAGFRIIIQTIRTWSTSGRILKHWSYRQIFRLFKVRDWQDTRNNFHIDSRRHDSDRESVDSFLHRRKELSNGAVCTGINLYASGSTNRPERSSLLGVLPDKAATEISKVRNVFPAESPGQRHIHIRFTRFPAAKSPRRATI